MGPYPNCYLIIAIKQLRGLAIYRADRFENRGQQQIQPLLCTSTRHNLLRRYRLTSYVFIFQDANAFVESRIKRESCGFGVYLDEQERHAAHQWNRRGDCVRQQRHALLLCLPISTLPRVGPYLPTAGTTTLSTSSRQHPLWQHGRSFRKKDAKCIQVGWLLPKIGRWTTEMN